MENESYHSENDNLKNNLASDPAFNQQASAIWPEQNSGDNKNLLGVFDLLSLSWKMFQERWTKFILLALILIVIQVGIQFLLGIIIMPLVVSSVMAAGQFNFVAIFLTIIIMAIIFSIPSLLITISIIRIIKDQNLGVLEAINSSYAKLVFYLEVSFIGALIMIGFFALYFVSAGLLMGGLVYIFSTTDSSTILNIVNWLLGLGVILCIFPIILIMQVWIFFALMAVVLENLRPIAAMSYSYELLKGKMRSIVWKFIVVVALFLLIVLGLFILLATVEGLAVLIVPLTFIFYFIGIFTMLIFYYNIYENLKAIKIEDIPANFADKNSKKIKILAIIGAVIISLYLAFSIIFTSKFNNMFSTDRFMDSFGPIDRNSGFDSDFKFNNENIENDELKYNDDLPLKRDLGNSVGRENDSRRKKDLEYIYSLLWRYKTQNGAYPISPLRTSLGDDNDIVRQIKSVGSVSIPTDPKEGYYYGYISSDGSNFELTARLEDLSDPECDVQRAICIYRLKSRP